MTDTAAFHAAFTETTQIIDGLVGQLTPEHREASTPCKDFTVHDLLNHVAGGGHMVSAIFAGEAPRRDVDWMSEAGGPVAGWEATRDAMRAAFSDDNLTSTKPAPTGGEAPGINFASLIVADHLVHAWDLAQAIGAEVSPSEATVSLAGAAMRPLITPGRRGGDAFEDEKPAPADATTLQQLIAYSGRTVG